jgi:NAD(P)-dependent dehydrogenase (short-subunit alcohol dehydrogenase family)
MSDSIFKLREKTIAIHGPIQSLIQALANVLQEHGADIALLHEKANESYRYVANLMEMRQIHSHYGRAAAVEALIQESKNAKESLSRAAELFGSVDVFIDCNSLVNSQKSETKPCEWFARESLEFFKSRGRGRTLFITYDNSIIDFTIKFLEKSKPKDNSKIEKLKKVESYNTELLKLTQNFKSWTQQPQITCNVLTVTFTEEFLLEFFGNQPLSSSMKIIRETWPEAKLTNTVDVANVVAFLVSSISNAINGETIRCCYGS